MTKPFVTMMLLLALLMFSALPMPAQTITEVGTGVRGQVIAVHPADNLILLRTADGKEMRLPLNAQTRLLLGQPGARIVDIREGMDLFVVYDGVGDRVLVRSVSAILPADWPEHRLVTVQGKVAKLQPAPNHFLILRTDKGQEWTVRPEGAVALRVNGKEVRWVDLQEGMEVVLVYEMRPVLLSVTSVTRAPEKVVVPAEAGTGGFVRGTVVAVREAEGVLIVRTAPGKETNLHVMAGADLRFENKPIRLIDLKADMAITAHYKMSDGKLLVTSVTGPNASAISTGQMRGKVMEADLPQRGMEVVLQDRDGKVVTTKTTQPDGTFLFENLAPGTYKTIASNPATRSVAQGQAVVKPGETVELILKLQPVPR